MGVPHSSVIRFLPLALLSTGIAVHGIGIVVRDEDPQRGSAFAMFASVDVGATRRVFATVPGEPPLVLEIPAELADQRDRLADTPDPELARHLAQRLLALHWKVRQTTATPGGGTELRAVRIEVVGLAADGRTIHRQTLVDVTVSGDAS